ncbi:unnamed protein product [Mytilus edulis]|uniref:Reverse transcriptase RNase H-like domain-containing protein n=1 Tax=Mytilus edulis TaxID=6550 RepID=A0A8S3QQS3_MYTED|nr:unnamed protein product [Mytilus edulis]
MVVTSKADGTPRRTVGLLQTQNRHSVRQTHHVLSPLHLADRVLQVPIREEDRHFTTFITPWGCYTYKVAPQGFISSGDAYNQRFDAIISNFNDKACEWFDLCARNGITLNPKKFQFAQDTVNFAGLTITPTNIRPSTKFLDAISNFPTPTDITGDEGRYSSFDPARMTCLATDWSVDGIDSFDAEVLLQSSSKTPTCCNARWKLCLVGRDSHPAESRYAPIEGEALAVVYALHQTRYYVLGCKDLLVATDHKPLLQILNDRSLTDIDNRRLLNLKEKTLGYRFTILHVPGRKNLGPDAASRYPVGPPDRLNLPGEAPELDSLVNMTAHYHSDTLTSSWKQGSQEDYRATTDLRPYHRFASSLCTVDGGVLMGQRIVIPPALRKPVPMAFTRSPPRSQR